MGSAIAVMLIPALAALAAEAGDAAGNARKAIESYLSIAASNDSAPAKREALRPILVALSLEESHLFMERIRAENRLDALIDTITSSNLEPPKDAPLKATLKEILGSGRADFYVEIPTYTRFFDKPKGYCYIRPDVYISDLHKVDPKSFRNVLIHEMWHSFSDHHQKAGKQGAHGGALDEGFGIAIRELAFTDKEYNIAETVYGTKNYYRDIGVWKKDPDYPFGTWKHADAKLRDALELIASRDMSRLAWDDDAKLLDDYERFFKGIRRDVDFYKEWMPAAEKATREMVESKRK